MRKSICVLICVLSFWPMLSQQTAIDSLNGVLSKTRNDIDRAQLLNEISSEYRQSDPKRMLEFGEKALALSRKINYRIAQGNAYLNIGNANVILGNYQQALRSFSDAQGIFESEP